MLTILSSVEQSEVVPVRVGSVALSSIAGQVRKQCVLTIIGSSQVLRINAGTTVHIHCSKTQTSAPASALPYSLTKPSPSQQKKGKELPPTALPPPQSFSKSTRQEPSPKRTVVSNEGEQFPPTYADFADANVRPTNPLAHHLPDPNETLEPGAFESELADGRKHAFDFIRDNPKFVEMVMTQCNLSYVEAVAKILAKNKATEVAPVVVPVQPSSKSLPTSALPRIKPKVNIGVNGNVVLAEADAPSVVYDDVPIDLRQAFHSSGRVRNVFEAILKYGHDEDFVPSVLRDFSPTDAPPGSSEKIEIFRRRLERGMPLCHPKDRVDFTNLVGAIRPRDD